MKTMASVTRWGFVLLLPLALGCGSGPALGKLFGKVTYNGTPVPGAVITFRPADARQNTVSAMSDADGNYEALVPVGDVKAAVDNRQMAPPPPHRSGVAPDLPPDALKALKGGTSGKFIDPGPNQPPRPAGKYIKLPDQYYDIEKSGLGFRVEGGSQEHNIEMGNPNNR